jgi:hypothetical protein
MNSKQLRGKSVRGVLLTFIGNDSKVPDGQLIIGTDYG